MGTRYALGGGTDDMTRLRRLGNRLLTRSSVCASASGTRTSATATPCSGGSTARAWPRRDGRISPPRHEQRWETASRSRRSSTFASPRKASLSPRCRASSMPAYMASATSTRSAMASACSARSSPNGGKPGAPLPSRPPSRPPRPPPWLGATPWLRCCRRMPPRPFCRRRTSLARHVGRCRAQDVARVNTAHTGNDRLNSLTVIVCAYADDRWETLGRAIGMALKQMSTDDQLIVVVDHNEPLLERCRAAFGDCVVLANTQRRGLSGARKHGAAEGARSSDRLSRRRRDSARRLA